MTKLELLRAAIDRGLELGLDIKGAWAFAREVMEGNLLIVKDVYIEL